MSFRIFFLRPSWLHKIHEQHSFYDHIAREICNIIKTFKY